MKVQCPLPILKEIFVTNTQLLVPSLGEWITRCKDYMKNDHVFATGLSMAIKKFHYDNFFLVLASLFNEKQLLTSYFNYKYIQLHI